MRPLIALMALAISALAVDLCQAQCDVAHCRYNKPVLNGPVARTVRAPFVATKAILTTRRQVYASPSSVTVVRSNAYRTVVRSRCRFYPFNFSRVVCYRR